MVLDNQRTDAPSGVVRAYDVRSGELRWAWNPIPPDAEPLNPDGTYRSGTTNVWSVLSVDEERNLVFVPTGNTNPDYFGGHREGLDHYSSSVVALDGDSGEVVWHFRMVHHDLWDYDTPAQPTLMELRKDGTADGFLTNLSRVAPKSAPMLDPALGVPINTAEVYMANPGSNSNQRSLLRVVNTTDTAGTVTVTGIDDNGDAAPSGSVSFQIGANEGLVLTIQDIENGDVSKGLTGALGDGAGKWRLTVESTVAIAVMSLLDTPNGFITNLSRPSEN